ncbi:MAG: divergent polysaccharide deacetylase family protein, partial [Kangiellaceae bacterium]|nr:divergent polysaccharide deacetylase family protein [Kangiellaceae bacterium]
MSINFQSKTIIASLLCLLLSVSSSASSIQEQTSIPDKDKQGKISIVIDDLGDNSIVARKLLTLPGTMTVAILPRTPHAKLISKLATEHGHDIIMHLP